MVEGRIITSLACLAMLDIGIKMVFPFGRSRNMEHCMSTRMGLKRGGEENYGEFETFERGCAKIKCDGRKSTVEFSRLLPSSRCSFSSSTLRL